MEGLTPMQTALLLMIVGMGTVFVILILIINLVVGIVVACTMYTFYVMFRRGHI